jgi:hypothetical protein
MPDQQPDYDALAKQAGGVDYDALAAKAQAGDEKPVSVLPSVWDRLKSANQEFIQNAPELKAARAIGNNQAMAGATVGALLGGIPGAALGGAAGEATQQLTDRALGRPAPATPLEAAKDIGVAGAVQGGLEAVTRGGSALVAPYLKSAAGRVMQSALKPAGKSVWKDVRAGLPIPKVVQTLLDEGINVSRGGIEKLNTIIGDINTEVQGKVGALTGTTDKATIAAHMAPAAMKLAKQGAPSADLRAFGNVVRDFMNHPIYQGALTPQEMQAMKMATYEGIDYTKMGGAAIQARKALGRGLKEEIEQTAKAQGVPEIRALNAREGRAIEAMDSVVRRVGQGGNNNPVGIAALAHAKGAFLGALVDRSPVVKSYIARGLYTPAASILGITPHLLRSLVVATVSLQDSPDGQ